MSTSLKIWKSGLTTEGAILGQAVLVGFAKGEQSSSLMCGFVMLGLDRLGHVA